MEKNKVYCVFCGTKNNFDQVRCTKCHKKLNPKERPLLDYLKSKISDKYMSDVEDTIYSILIHYIKSHLYGVVVTCSIVVSAFSVVVNADFNRLEKVDEKPTVVNRISYAGKGLNSLEVAEKYIEALQSSDMLTVKNLQLETFHPEVLAEIKDDVYYYSNGLDTTMMIQDDDLVQYASSLFKDNKGEIYIGDSELVIPSGNFGGYSFRRYLISMKYCYGNICVEEDGYDSNAFYARLELELVEVDGAYYVTGSNEAVFMGENLAIEYYTLLDFGGDMDALTYDAFQDYDNNCYDRVNDCFSKFNPRWPN